MMVEVVDLLLQFLDFLYGHECGFSDSLLGVVVVLVFLLS